MKINSITGYLGQLASITDCIDVFAHGYIDAVLQDLKNNEIKGVALVLAPADKVLSNNCSQYHYEAKVSVIMTDPNFLKNYPAMALQNTDDIINNLIIPYFKNGVHGENNECPWFKCFGNKVEEICTPNCIGWELTLITNQFANTQCVNKDLLKPCYANWQASFCYGVTDTDIFITNKSEGYETQQWCYSSSCANNQPLPNSPTNAFETNNVFTSGNVSFSFPRTDIMQAPNAYGNKQIPVVITLKICKTLDNGKTCCRVAQVLINPCISTGESYIWYDEF